MLFFSPSGGLFSLQKKEEIQWYQGKEKGKKKEKKDEVLGLEDGILGAGQKKGEKEEKKEEDLERCVSYKALCLLIYSVFCNPVRINYNLPAGYGASAVTAFLYFPTLAIAACAAANLAIGTRNGEQET